MNTMKSFWQTYTLASLVSVLIMLIFCLVNGFAWLLKFL